MQYTTMKLALATPQTKGVCDTGAGNVANAVRDIATTALMSRELTLNYERNSTYNQCNQVYKSPNCTCNSPNCTYKSLNSGNSAYVIYYVGVSGVPHLYENSKLHNQSCQS